MTPCPAPVSAYPSTVPDGVRFLIDQIADRPGGTATLAALVVAGIDALGSGMSPGQGERVLADLTRIDAALTRAMFVLLGGGEPRLG